MKKSLIASAGAAAFAMAAFPFAGAVFADSTMTDTLQVTIDAACTIVNDNTTGQAGGSPSTANSYQVNMKNGQLKSDIGNSGSGTSGGGDNTIAVSCNAAQGATGAGWTLSATAKDSNTNLASGVTDVDIPAGTETSGATSQWAYKVASSSENVTFTNGYSNTFKAITTSNQQIASGSGSADFTMTYQVYVSQGQAQGVYSGGVVYTVAPSA